MRIELAALKGQLVVAEGVIADFGRTPDGHSALLKPLVVRPFDPAVPLGRQPAAREGHLWVSWRKGCPPLYSKTVVLGTVVPYEKRGGRFDYGIEQVDFIDTTALVDLAREAIHGSSRGKFGRLESFLADVAALQQKGLVVHQHPRQSTNEAVGVITRMVERELRSARKEADLSLGALVQRQLPAGQRLSRAERRAAERTRKGHPDVASPLLLEMAP